MYEAQADALHGAGKLVRILLLDEAGVSSLAQDPWLVVAGVLVHGDKQYRPVEAHLEELVQQYIPPKDRHGFVFHATDIFHGSDYWDRDVWPQFIRWEILEQILAIPAKLSLPVCVGITDRKSPLPATVERTPKNILEVEHMAAFAQAITHANGWLRENAPDELAMIVAEDSDRVKPFVRLTLKFFNNKAIMGVLGYREGDQLPLTNYIDTVHFAGKRDSRPLQVADACAFTLKRALASKPEMGRFLKQFWNQVIFRAISPSADEDPWVKDYMAKLLSAGRFS